MSSAITSQPRIYNSGLSESTRTSPAKLAEYIQVLQAACQKDPHSADLRTCLGIAQARNFEVGKSLESFEAAIGLDASHFFARYKYAELLFGLGSFDRAERETLKAAELANSKWALSMARRQLDAIWRRLHDGVQ